MDPGHASLSRAFWCASCPLVVSSLAICSLTWVGPVHLSGLLWLAVGPVLLAIGMTHVLRHVRAKRSLAAAGLVCVALLLNLPFAWVALSVRPRPKDVPPDWVKARAMEFHRDGAERVPWNRVGPDQWYFPNEMFGARRFLRETFTPEEPWRYDFVIRTDGTVGEPWFVLLSPVHDDFAYVLRADGRVQRSPDDAFSLGLNWPVEQRSTDDFPERELERWPEVR